MTHGDLRTPREKHDHGDCPAHCAWCASERYQEALRAKDGASRPSDRLFDGPNAVEALVEQGCVLELVIGTEGAGHLNGKMTDSQGRRIPYEAVPGDGFAR